VGNGVNYSLYLVTDSALSLGRSLLGIVRAAVDGGVTCVQVREKTVSSRAYLERLAPVRPLLRERGVPLFINDRIDIALAIEADGVHLGQTDMPLALAKRIAGDRLVIGISCETIQDAIEAEHGGADYVSVSPVFSTPTKTDTAAPLGVEGVQAIRATVRVPVVTIGGVNATNAADVIRAGADGVCVVSAIVAAPDPRAAACELRGIVEGARAWSLERSESSDSSAG
jgi:thiamine-phosphate pyrophosphorylase